MDAVAQAIVTTSVAVRVPKKSAESLGCQRGGKTPIVVSLSTWRQEPNCFGVHFNLCSCLFGTAFFFSDSHGCDGTNTHKSYAGVYNNKLMGYALCRRPPTFAF